jgi:hypothetical protein|tara:strand:- start:127 stop:687 length:561 start_codon:yes stop_codon:yes gene_type:complete
MEYSDTIIDKSFAYELANYYKTKVKWHANNHADASYPYKDNPAYNLFGIEHFLRKNIDVIEYGPDMNMNVRLIDLWNHLKTAFGKPHLFLHAITANLQFKGMDGGLHRDDYDKGEGTSFIVMLSPNNDTENIGGEFYNDTLKKSVDFKHARVVMLDSTNLHLGRAFNVPHKMRISLRLSGFDTLIW